MSIRGKVLASLSVEGVLTLNARSDDEKRCLHENCGLTVSWRGGNCVRATPGRRRSRSASDASEQQPLRGGGHRGSWRVRGSVSLGWGPVVTGWGQVWPLPRSGAARRFLLRRPRSHGEACSDRDSWRGTHRTRPVLLNELPASSQEATSERGIHKLPHHQSTRPGSYLNTKPWPQMARHSDRPGADTAAQWRQGAPLAPGCSGRGSANGDRPTATIRASIPADGRGCLAARCSVVVVVPPEARVRCGCVAASKRRARNYSASTRREPLSTYPIKPARKVPGPVCEVGLFSVTSAGR